jgi:hyperosmotically inducible protein
VAERTKEGATKTKDAVVKGARIVADKTEDGLSKTGEVMTDGWITSRVHARFVNEDLLKGSDISVDTSKHVVTLKGTVTARAGRNRATTVARQTEGVRRVVNQLTIGPKRKG